MRKKKAASAPGRIGKPTANQSRVYRRQTLEYIIAEYKKHPEQGRVTRHDVAKIIKTSSKGAALILQDVVDMIHTFKPTRTEDGIAWGGEGFYETHLLQNVPNKLAIAKRFAEVIPSTTSIACSAGSTVAFCIRELNRIGKPVHVVTNNVAVVEEWSGVEEGLDLTGGVYNNATNSLTGQSVAQAFARFRCSVGLIGVSGVDAQGRLFVRHRWEAHYRQSIVNSVTDVVYIVADIEKFIDRDLWQIATVRELLEMGPGRSFMGFLAQRPEMGE